MANHSHLDSPVDEGDVIYTMTIRLKNGRVIRRPNGRPFRIVIRRKRNN